jgi:hypothetical protein
MDDISQINDVQAIEAIVQKLLARKKEIKKVKKDKLTKAKEAAQRLSVYTQNIINAQGAYETEGFTVVIETDPETGLIKKWSLKNRFPRRSSLSSVRGAISSNPTLKVDELEKILPLLPAVFGAKDIARVLEQSGIGARKLQPTFGNYLKGLYGPAKAKKTPDSPEKGPGVRYKLV